MEHLRIYFVTYNVGTSTPESTDFLPLLNLTESAPGRKTKNSPDFYVIALQEVNAQPHNLLMDALNEDPWTRTFMEVLGNRNYVKLKTIRLQGLVLSLFSLKQHLLNVRDLESEYTRTGFAGMWGNKGAVSIRLSIYGCCMCFVNAHLAAHDDQLDERIEDYNSIIEHQNFHVTETEFILLHDYVFWMGDLNFRLAEEYNKNPEEIEHLVNKGELDELFQNDQLRILMEQQKAFSEFKENPPKFPPTFKFEVGEDKYDHKRRPAWTDRILYKVNKDNYNNVELNAEQTAYTSHPMYTLSDHKPVTAEFTLKTKNMQIALPDSQVFSDYGEEVIRFSPIDFWVDNNENLVEYKFLQSYEPNQNDWIGVYKENFASLDDYESYEYVERNASPTPVMKYKTSPPVTPEKSPSSEKDASAGGSHAKSFQMTFSTPSGSRREHNATAYVLIYVSETEDKVRSVLGVSKPFVIRDEDQAKGDSDANDSN